MQRRWRLRHVTLAAFACSIACLAALVACGGTTGREGLTVSTSTAGVDGAADATMSGNDDASEVFDTAIQYVDRALPDVGMASEGGGGAVEAGVLCAPDIPAVYLADGGIALVLDGALLDNPTEVPAIFTNGGQAPAPEGSECATQVWLGAAACDQCLRDQTGGVPGDPWAGQYGPAELPPCSDLWEAGTAAVGMGAGQTRYQLCIALLDCMLASHCATDDGLNGCICTLPMASTCVSQGGSGPCINQALAAAEITGGTAGSQFLALSKQSGSNTGTVVGHAWGGVSKMAKDAFSYCQPQCPFTNAITDGGAG